MVTVKGSRPVRSPFVRADESGLWVKTFDRDRTLMSIARVDVVEIRQVNKLGHPARKGALIGLAAGSVIPLIVGVNCSGPECASAVGSTFAFYGGIGAAVGALIGAVAHKTEKMIYRAP
jgi:hypothetical protein